MVSVIIPNYNHAPYLKQRIDSVLTQTFRDMEVIILDDCSTDRSRDIIEQYRSHPKVSHIVYNDANSGSTFKQWKKGIALAKGEYVWIAESDDFSDVSFLQTAISAFERDAAVGMVQTQSFNYDENNPSKNVWTDRIMRRDWVRDFRADGRQMIHSYMLKNNPIVNVSAVVFRRSAIEEKMIDTSFKLNGDWLFYINVLLQSDFFHIAKPLNYFRQHGNKGGSRNVMNYNNIIELARIIRFLFRRVSLNGQEKSMLRYIFVSRWAEQANNSLFLLLKNKFVSISAEAVKNDPLFFFRLLKKLYAKRT
jgi:glycosyltransferase involved in cell wall biosynthesis